MENDFTISPGVSGNRFRAFCKANCELTAQSAAQCVAGPSQALQSAQMGDWHGS
jgi:hypothetical protein